MFYCDNPDAINDNDEMWVSELRVTGTKLIKFKDMHGFTSPEDFISGIGQNPSSWKEKEVINL